MNKKTVACLLALAMTGTTITTPVFAAPAAQAAEQMEEDVTEQETVTEQEAATGQEKSVTEQEIETEKELSANTLSENELEEETVYSYSGYTSLEKQSKYTIGSAYRNLYSYAINYGFYSSNPNAENPYSVGALSDQHVMKALDSVNLMRTIAGLPNVSLNSSLVTQAQQGALVLAANDQLNQYPSQPANMAANIYAGGRTATQYSNIASGTDTGLASYVKGFMDDKQASQVANVAERRYILNPQLGKTAFGYATRRNSRTYALMYNNDTSASTKDYDFISWPASGNFPAELCRADMPWSVSLNPNKFKVSALNINDITVTITAPNGKEKKIVAKDNQNDKYDTTKSYFNINLDSYGIANAIIFRPGTADFGTNNLNGTYSVVVRGVKESSGKAAIISYNVECFNARDYKGGDNDAAMDDTQVSGFVNRLYTLCFNRAADDEGMVTWKNALVNRTKSGADVAKGFFFSQEMNNRKLSDSEFLEILYRVMMNRASDAGGKAYWTERLNAGMSREGIYKGFAESTEFQNVCDAYGITRGTAAVSQGRDLNAGATMFVSRLYTQALGRAYDVNGLNDWCKRINNKTWSVTDVATTGFFHSPEFTNKNLSNREYVKVLYRTFLGREYDAAGLADWCAKLDSGKQSRDEVLRGFSNSVEFANIKKAYGF